MHFFSQAAKDGQGNKFTARIKISGPEQTFYYLLRLTNLLIGIVTFSVLRQSVPSYADTMAKVESASGVSIEVMIYVVAPTMLVLSALSRILYHKACETWKEVDSVEKGTRRQFIPKPKGMIKLKTMSIPEPEPANTVAAEVGEMIEHIREKRNDKI